MKLFSAIVTLVLLAAGAASAAGAAEAAAATPSKLVSYHGYRFRVPAAWPVFRLDRKPSTCVRFNRHAVYLGTPSLRQACPAAGLGRTEAILVSPSAAAGGIPRPTAGTAQPLHGSIAQRLVSADHVIVTATWGSNPAVVSRAVGDSTIGSLKHVGISRTVRAVAAKSTPVAKGAGTVYTGTGFDACTDPGPNQLNAWLSSSYRAFGAYIGGTNMACSQPNLTPTNVSAEVAAGWHLIPTYVGLQAPSNSCGCAAITPSKAAAQGTAAALDAVTSAQAAGIGAGSPIYNDMEYYPRTATNTSAVLAFLSAWTAQLHTSGYLSGVYGNSDSVMSDMVAAKGTTFNEPDDVWIANWNGVQSTSDSLIPSTYWAAHQRLHQYGGAHNETHGGVTINIDGDYVDGATVGTGTVTPPAVAAAPSLSIAPQPDGSINFAGSWSGANGIAAWRLLGGPSATSLSPLSNQVASGTIVTHSAYPYYAEEAYGSAGQLLGVSPVTATPPHVAIYGHSAFVPAVAGLAGLPVGCFTGATCHVTTSIWVGRTLVARTNPERVPVGRSGIVYFAPTSAGRRLLQAAPGHRLAATVTVLDSSGSRARRVLNLIPYAAAGRGPARSSTASASVTVIGYTDFVNRNGVGGILAGCFAAQPCTASATVTAGGATIAQTGPEFMGANELSYLSFRLTAQGQALLAGAAGNQLGASLKLTTGSDSARAAIALIRFS